MELLKHSICPFSSIDLGAGENAKYCQDFLQNYVKIM